MCQPLQAVPHTQEGGNELHHPDHTALQAPLMCESRQEREVYVVRHLNPAVRQIDGGLGWTEGVLALSMHMDE